MSFNHSGLITFVARLILTTLAVIFSTLSLATPIVLKQGDVVRVTQQIEYLFENTTANTDEDGAEISPLQQLAKPGWKQVEKNRVNFGFIKDPVWLTFEVMSKQDREWIFHLTYPLLDYLDIYVYDQQEQLVTNVFTGDLRPFHNRPINQPGFAVPIPMEANQRYRIMLRISTKGAAEAPIVLEESDKFNEDQLKREFVRGIVNGILALMLFYNLIIFLFIKSKTYLIYVLNVAVYIVQLNVFDGNGFRLMWPEQPELNLYLFPIFNALMQLTQFLFLVAFLDLLNRHTMIRLPIKIVIAILFMLPILGVTMDYHVIIPVQVIFALLVNLSGLAFSFYYALKGETSARYFFVAWFLFIIGLIIVNLKSFGLVPNNVYIEYSYQIGAFVEMTLLSLALAQRIQSSQNQVIALQDENIKTLEKYQNLYENSLSGQFQSDEEGRVLSVNPAFKQMFDRENKWAAHGDTLKNDQSKQLNVVDLVVERDDLEILDTALKEKSELINFEIKLKDSRLTQRWYSVSIRPETSDLNGKTLYDVSIIDIHEKKENDELKEKALNDRMATLEHLAIGICHELNTPLGISLTSMSHLNDLTNTIRFNTEKGTLTKSDLIKLLDEEKSASDLIISNLSKASELIQKFRHVSVKQLAIDMEDRNALEVIMEAVNEADVYHGQRDIIFNVECHENFVITGRTQAIKMILEELIQNSIQHSYEHNPKGIITISFIEKQDGYVLDYQDDGEGIDHIHRQEMFNAFFTTKRGSMGRVGLGLYKVYNLATQLLHGSIEHMETDHVHFRLRFPKQ